VHIISNFCFGKSLEASEASEAIEAKS